MNGSIRRSRLAPTSVSNSIGGTKTIGDVLRKARTELIVKRICYGLLLAVIAAFIVYLAVSGYFSELIDASLSFFY